MRQLSARVRQLLEELRPISDTARVLEIGSGAHGLIFNFGSQRAVGIDPLAHHYAFLFPHWQRSVPTVAAFGEALPFADASFDVVLCDNVVDHAESPAGIVSEIARVLAPDGVLYFTVNVHHPVYRVASGLHAAWHRAGIDFDIGPFADHTVHLTLARARELFADQPLEFLKETSDRKVLKSRALRTPVRRYRDYMKRVFFKNARYEVIAVRL